MNVAPVVTPTTEKATLSHIINNGDAESNCNNLSDIVESIENSKPEISDHAINSYNQKEAEQKENFAGLVDRDGNPFDPNIHRTNSSGEPVLTASGKLSKKAGVKKGGAAPNQKQSFVGGQKQPDPADLQKIQCRATGIAAANTIITLGVVMGGDEWQPIKNTEYGIDEKANLENAFANYFEATGQTDLPPNLALTIACAAYALPRFTMPKTKARSGKVIGWLKQKWADRQLKKHGLKTAKIVEKSDKAGKE